MCIRLATGLLLCSYLYIRTGSNWKLYNRSHMVRAFTYTHRKQCEYKTGTRVDLIIQPPTRPNLLRKQKQKNENVNDRNLQSRLPGAASSSVHTSAKSRIQEETPSELPKGLHVPVHSDTALTVLHRIRRALSKIWRHELRRWKLHASDPSQVSYTPYKATIYKGHTYVAISNAHACMCFMVGSPFSSTVREFATEQKWGTADTEGFTIMAVNSFP